MSNENISIEKYNLIYYILAFLGIILFFCNILLIRPIRVNIDDFLGMVSHLTALYWIGYLIIIICIIKLYTGKEKSDILYLIFLVLLVLYLFGLPIFAEENARFAWSYYPAGEVKSILQTNNMGNVSQYDLGSYRSWPTTHIVSLFMVRLTNIDVDSLVKYMPLYWALSVMFIAYSIGKLIKMGNNHKFGNNHCFMISILILSSFWTINNYYGPQSLAYILYLLFFSSFIFTYRVEIKDIMNRNMMSQIIFMVLVFTANVTTHMLTSISLISSFILSSKLVKSIYENRLRLIILFMVIFIGWYIYVARIMFNAGVSDLIDQITTGEFFSVFQGEKYNAGTTLIRELVHYSRFSYLGIYAILISIAIIFYLKNKVENKELFKLAFLWLIGTAILITLRYGAEIDDRVYILSLLPMAIILITTYNERVISILVIILLSLHIPAHYGTESYDMTYDTDLLGSKFLATNANHDDAINYYFIPLIRYYDPKFENAKGFYSGYYNPDNKSIEESTYVISSTQLSNYLQYVFGVDKIQMWLKSNDARFLLYDNGNFRIYEK